MGKWLSILCVSLFAALLAGSGTMARADYANFDATGLRDDSTATLVLNGPWMFAWNQLLPPEQAVQSFKDKAYPVMPVPSNWAGKLPKDATNPRDHGVATFVAALSLPEIQEADLALNMGVVHDAYRVFWAPADTPHNAVLIAQEGNLTGDALAAQRFLNHALPVSGDGFLVLHVRKTMFAWGGISKAPFVARATTAQLSNNRRSLLAGLTIGMLLLIMLRNVMLYASKLREPAAGLLATITFFVILRALAVENLPEMFFGAQWHGLRMRIEIGLVPVLASWVLIMLEVLFPRPTRRRLRRLLHVVLHLIGATALLVPLDRISDVLIVAQIAAVVSFIPGVLHIASALRSGNREARILGVSTLLCLGAGMNDIYASLSDTYGAFLIPLSVVYLMMILSQIIGNRASVAIARTALLEAEKEQLSRDRNDAIYMSRHDHLTGLLNRQSFDHHWARNWLDAVETKQPLTVVLFDIDHFKSINDTYGHPTGDAVLKALAHRLTAFDLRKTDRLCRYGGEEFALILPNCSTAEGVATAERLRSAIASRPLLDDPQISVTCSFGVAATNRNFTKSAETLLNGADAALYSAKANGRNRVETCSGRP